MGVVSGKLAVGALGLGECQVVALQELGRLPQLLASDRHVSMDAVSVRSCTHGDREMTVVLEGVVGDTVRYWFHLPAAMVCRALTATGATASRSSTQGLLLAELTFTEPQATLTLTF